MRILRKAFAVTTLIALSGAVSGGIAYSQQVPGCERQLTVERLSDPACLPRIGVPQPRPDRERASASVEKKGRIAAVTYIDTPTGGGETRRIRLVGVPFLADDAGQYRLKHEISLGSDPLNAMFYSVASMIMERKDGAEPKGVETAAAASADAAPVVEARANLDERMMAAN